MRNKFHVLSQDGKQVNMNKLGFPEIKARIQYGERNIMRRTAWVKAIDYKIQNCTKDSTFKEGFIQYKTKEKETILQEITDKRLEIAELRIVLAKRELPAVPHLPEYAELFGLTFIQEESVATVNHVLEEVDVQQLCEYTVEKIKRLPTDQVLNIAKSILNDHYYGVRRMSEKEIAKL